MIRIIFAPFITRQIFCHLRTFFIIFAKVDFSRGPRAGGRTPLRTRTRQPHRLSRAAYVYLKYFPSLIIGWPTAFAGVTVVECLIIGLLIVVMPMLVEGQVKIFTPLQMTLKPIGHESPVAW